MNQEKQRNPELERVQEAKQQLHNWKRWGPYLSERQWGTVREDYSDHGDCWNYFNHDMSRFRAYRWGEDGLMGICDRDCQLNFALALWNKKDPILKERLFGLTGPEGNHGEDVKEEYFYLDSTPTHSYMKGLYKYPIDEYPYAQLVEENRKRGVQDREYELRDTGVFDDNNYFDVQVEYAKRKANDICIKISVTNRSKKKADITVLPTLWFRNTWSWKENSAFTSLPVIRSKVSNTLETSHPKLGCFYLDAKPLNNPKVQAIFTNNETRHFFEDKKKKEQEEAVKLKLFEDKKEELELKIEALEIKKKTKNDEDILSVLKEELDTLIEEFEDNKEEDEEKTFIEEMTDNRNTFVKDAFHRFIVDEEEEAVNNLNYGTKSAYIYRLEIEAGKTETIELRLYSSNDTPRSSFGQDFEEVFKHRKEEADTFYNNIINPDSTPEQYNIIRQAYAGLLWSKQFYHYIVETWINGDPGQPASPQSRLEGRNKNWKHLYNRDVISMPDKWEYPWYAAWDLAFHMIPFVRVDQEFAERQLKLLLKEWYMHPNGQIPAYEFSFSDVNSPVHAWACWRVYKHSVNTGQRNIAFLEETFQKLLINFTWWVNQKDEMDNNLFSGGFLGLDNITIFDRSNLPKGSQLIQADGTAWMAFYCTTMLRMSIELSKHNSIYEGMVIKFFEHFISISRASNEDKAHALWDEEDGFYYDNLLIDGQVIPLRVRSLVGLVSLFSSTIIDQKAILNLPFFERRMNTIMEQYEDVGKCITFLESDGNTDSSLYLLATPSRSRLLSVLKYLLDEDEFLSDYGIRSLSKVHANKPVSFNFDGQEYSIEYTPGESTTYLFGGNSNWRGPIWFPLNHLIIESLRRNYEFYGDSLKVECPTGSGVMMNLNEVAIEISKRLSNLFLKDKKGVRPFYGKDNTTAQDEDWSDLIQYFEYFHAETGRGLGASHQTGWTALIIECLEFYNNPGKI